MGFNEEFAVKVGVTEANVSRTWGLTGTSVAIFTFVLSLFYPRYTSGEINRILFQVVLTVIGFAIISFVFAGNAYYFLTLPHSLSSTELAKRHRRADLLWLTGFSLLLLEPTLILFTVRLVVVATVFLVMWIAYLIHTLYGYMESQAQLRRSR